MSYTVTAILIDYSLCCTLYPLQNVYFCEQSWLKLAEPLSNSLWPKRKKVCGSVGSRHRWVWGSGCVLGVLSRNVSQLCLPPLPFFSGRHFSRGSKSGHQLSQASLLPARPHRWERDPLFQKSQSPGRILMVLLSFQFPPHPHGGRWLCPTSTVQLVITSGGLDVGGSVV